MSSIYFQAQQNRLSGGTTGLDIYTDDAGPIYNPDQNPFHVVNNFRGDSIAPIDARMPNIIGSNFGTPRQVNVQNKVVQVIDPYKYRNPRVGLNTGRGIASQIDKYRNDADVLSSASSDRRSNSPPIV